MIDPTIRLVPSAYKTSKVYSPLPIDGVGDFTFARIATATRVNPDGLIETVATGIPRIDHSTDCPHLLLEPASTNLLTYSNDFTNAAWAKTRTTITDNQAISPTGELNADKVVCTGVADPFVSQTIATGSIAGNTYTFSVWLWTDESQPTEATLFMYGATGVEESNFVNLVLTSTPTRYDITTTFTGGAVSTSLIVRIDLIQAAVAGNYLYAFGAQLEELNYATSYIPTNTTPAGRIAETCNSSGDATLFNSTEGVLYAEIEALFDDETTTRRITISDGTTNNRVMALYSASLNTFAAQVIVGGVGQCSFSVSIGDQENKIKFALKYKENDFALWIDGVEVGTDASGSTFVANTLTELAFDDGNNSFDFYGRCYDLRVYDTALTDTELAELTT